MSFRSRFMMTGEKTEPSVKVFAYTFALTRGDKGYESRGVVQAMEK